MCGVRLCSEISRWDFKIYNVKDVRLIYVYDSDREMFTYAENAVQKHFV